MDIFTIGATVIGVCVGAFCALESRGSRKAHRVLKLGDWYVQSTEHEQQLADELRADIDAAYFRQMTERFEQGRRETVPVVERLCDVIECMGCDSVFTTTEENVSPLTLCPECAEHGPQPMPASPVRQLPAVMLN